MVKAKLLPKKSFSHGYKKAFSIFLALYPLLCLYKAVSRFTIGDALLICFLFVTLVHKMSVKIDLRFWAAAMFILYAVVTLVFNLLLSPITVQYGATSLLWRIIKFIFYMACVFVCSDNALDYAVFRKALTITAIVASLFLIFQYLLYLGFGKVVLGRIPFLQIYVEEYASQESESIFKFNFRPSAFFFEPAMFAQYVAVPLVLNLFDKKNCPFKRGGWITALLTVAIILCTSGQGILYLAIIYLVYGIFFIKNRTRLVLLVVLAVAICLIGYFTIDALRFGIDRLFFNENASEARLGTYSFCLSLEGVTMIWGYGYGTTPYSLYMAGAAYVWYGCGIVGLILALSIFASFIYRADGIAYRTIAVLFLVMFFGTCLFYTYMAFWYFSLVVCKHGKSQTAIYIVPDESIALTEAIVQENNCEIS